MLDVHPPHAPTHTWKDFFIHIATIVVGLILAVGLEQGVEALHHAHQRNELHEALRADTEKTIEDTEAVERYRSGGVQWLNGIIGEIDDALDTGRPLGYPPPHPHLDFDAPDDPAWKAASSSGLLELLSQQDIKAYSEVDHVLATAEALHTKMNANYGPKHEFEEQFMRHGATRADFSHATPEELKQYRALLVVYRDSISNYASWCHDAHGAEVAILHGERDVNRIQKAER
jgi:hypothetical protein